MSVDRSVLDRPSRDDFRPIVPGESDLPWTGMIFGVTVNSVWYWCTDQVIRILIYERLSL